MNIWPRRQELKKETRQAAVSRRRVTQSNLSCNWRQTIWFLTSKIPAPDPPDMYPCPIQMRAQSFQNFSRKAILMRVDWNSRISVSRPLAVQNRNPAPHSDVCNGRDTLIGGFESTPIPQMPLVEISAPVMLRKLILQLQDRFSREILEAGIEVSFGGAMDTYLVDREPVFSR